MIITASRRAPMTLALTPTATQLRRAVVSRCTVCVQLRIVSNRSGRQGLGATSSETVERVRRRGRFLAIVARDGVGSL
jgi:hypothetical protein